MQQCVNKAQTRHHRRSTQLDELLGVAEEVALRVMEEITKTKEDLPTIQQMNKEHPIEK